MSSEQLQQLIEAIRESGNGLSTERYIFQLVVPILVVVITACVSYKVAKYQVENSEKQNNSNRKEDIERQKQFMIDELKLKTTEKLLESTARINRYVLKMLELSHERYKIYLNTRMNNSKYSSEAVKINLLIQDNYDEIQTYLSTLFTFTKLFDVKKTELNVSEFKKSNSDLLNACLNDDIYKTFDDEIAEISLGLHLQELGQSVLEKINDFDYIVRVKQIDLIGDINNKKP